MIYVLLCYCLLNIIYQVGFFVTSILTRVGGRHYFLGFYPKLFSFHVKEISFDIGIYIPLVGLARIYSVVDGKRQRTFYPWEFDRRSIGRRLLATLGGALALALSGVIIFIVIAYVREEYIISKEEINKHGIYPSPWAEELGFQHGDKIIDVNGNDYTDFRALIDPDVLLSEGNYYTVLRNEEQIRIDIHSNVENFGREDQPFLSLLAPFEVYEIIPHSPAIDAGLIKGDRIKKVNGQPIIKVADMQREFEKDEDGQVVVEIERRIGANIETSLVTVTLDAEKKIGIYIRELIDYQVYKNSLGQAVVKGSRLAIRTATTSVAALARLSQGSSVPSKVAGGPMRISQIHSQQFSPILGANAIWFALWNLLPLPKSALWEIIALTYEGVMQKRYSFSAFRKLQNFGWILFATFIVWNLINDIVELF